MVAGHIESWETAAVPGQGSPDVGIPSAQGATAAPSAHPAPPLPRARPPVLAPRMRCAGTLPRGDVPHEDDELFHELEREVGGAPEEQGWSWVARRRSREDTARRWAACQRSRGGYYIALHSGHLLLAGAAPPETKPTRPGLPSPRSTPPSSPLAAAGSGVASLHDMAVRRGGDGMDAPYPAHGGLIGSGQHEMARFISDEANAPSATVFEARRARNQGARFDSAVTLPAFIGFLGGRSDMMDRSTYTHIHGLIQML
ncbi:hypothetical protein ACQ4PT_020732 [Festuca glaucescens]